MLPAQDGSGGADLEPVTVVELGSAVAFAALETLVVGRCFLVALLEERTVMMSHTPNPLPSPNPTLAPTPVPHTPTPHPNPSLNPNQERNYALARNIRKAHFGTKVGDTVVAVLGAALLNGVKRLLTSSRVV